MQASHRYTLDQGTPNFSLPHTPPSDTAQTGAINSIDERLRNSTQQFRNRIPTSDTVFADLRHRPRYPRIQCRWTYPPFGKGVDTCRYGKQCQYGHEGDEYYEQVGLRYHWVNGERFAERYAGTDSTTSDQAFWAAGNEKQWREGEQGIWGGVDVIKMCEQGNGAVMIFGKPSSSEGYSSGEESAESSGRGKKRRMGNARNNCSSGGGAGGGMWIR